MSILAVTIPRTGTRFITQMFKDNGLVWLPYGERPADIYFMHMYSGFLPRILAFDGQIICPMRKLESIKDSWAAANRRGIWFASTLAECLAVFEKIKDRALVLHIDDEAVRDAELAAISDVVGVELKTDWAVVGARR